VASGGLRDLIPTIARTAVAVGVDGIFMEVYYKFILEVGSACIRARDAICACHMFYSPSGIRPVLILYRVYPTLR
jgi:hypothetical protein